MNYMSEILKLSLILCLLGLCYLPMRAQVVPWPRHPNQKYIEDSIHVYFINLYDPSYPDPFSPPTVSDSGKGIICGGGFFYCDLSESALLAFVNDNDSIIYSAIVRSSKPPDFSFCYWKAGPRAKTTLLPREFYRSKLTGKVKVVLSIAGRRKCLSEFAVEKGWSYWIDDQTSRKDR
jgi:hypothetical protein